MSISLGAGLGVGIGVASGLLFLRHNKPCRIFDYKLTLASCHNRTHALARQVALVVDTRERCFEQCVHKPRLTRVALA